MRRREFITLAGSAAAWPLAARGQQPKMPIIGHLSLGVANSSSSKDMLSSFLQGLKEVGYVDQANVMIEYRWANLQNDRLQELATDLVARRVSVIAAMGNPLPAIVAKATTTTIPIVFATAVNPIEFGLVPSLSRPGGNITGVTSLNLEIGPKRLELLHELIAPATTAAVLVNVTNPQAEPSLRELEAAARTLGVTLHVLKASTDQEIDSAFTSIVRLRPGGLVIDPDAFFNSRLERLAALALRNAVPTIYYRPSFAAAGGLMSYGGDSTDAYRIAGVYTGRILKGERPADLPVQQATKIELVINLKTAKALGLNVPITLLGRADEIIE
jgi:putative ABC transport system substrate-binding protein